MTTAAIFDLDRTVLRGSSAPVIQRHLKAAGLASRDFPAERLFQATYELFGESRLVMRAAKSQSGCKPGWRVDEIANVAKTIADELLDQVQSFVPALLAEHKAAGRKVVLATGSNLATITAFADRLGFDHVIATKWTVDGEAYTGAIEGDRLLGEAKLAAVKAWAQGHGVDLAGSYMYSDSRYDADLLAAVGNPVAVNPDAGLAVIARLRGWKVRHFDKPEGVVKLAGRELQGWLRPLGQPAIDPLATLRIEGLENIPSQGGVILAFNHRSYYDSTAVAYVIAKSGRDGRFLGKKEVFDVPVVGTLAKAIGGIRVDRGTGSDEPLEHAAEALRGGDLIAMAPQGTIPRGPAFFEPELKARWGAARLAKLTGAVVVPVGLWGTEKVWPRSSQIPKITLPGQTKPTVTVKVGKPFKVTSEDPEVATKQIMKKITALLPPEARQPYTPTAEELRATYPSGYKGDPATEAVRRPGTDT
ncbi:MAG TPA: HAD-IB family hydrolase [Acidimicrobiales bacterium]|nr:HAD-IB family hydrolase [Acidimicrobiales bacterium]